MPIGFVVITYGKFHQSLIGSLAVKGKNAEIIQSIQT